MEKVNLRLYFFLQNMGQGIWLDGKKDLCAMNWILSCFKPACWFLTALLWAQLPGSAITVSAPSFLSHHSLGAKREWHAPEDKLYTPPSLSFFGLWAAKSPTELE